MWTDTSIILPTSAVLAYMSLAKITSLQNLFLLSDSFLLTLTYIPPQPEFLRSTICNPKQNVAFLHLFFGTLSKKKLWYRCFPVNFAKFLRTPFLQNTSWRLLLLYRFKEKIKEKVLRCIWAFQLRCPIFWNSLNLLQNFHNYATSSILVEVAKYLKILFVTLCLQLLSMTLS